MNIILLVSFVTFSSYIRAYILSPVSPLLYTKNVKLFGSPPAKPNESCPPANGHAFLSLNEIIEQHKSMERLSSPQFTKVIINKCYGGFSFSESFRKEFERAFNKTHAIHFFTHFYDPYNDENHTNENIESRYDKTLIQFIENTGGLKNCEGSYSKLGFELVPTELVKYIQINEYDGLESITINISRMYKDLLVDIMERRYIMYFDVLKFIEIQTWEKYLKNNNKRYL